MSVVVDTTQLPSGDRFDAWAEAALKVFEPISVRRRASSPFDGRLSREEIGPLQLLHLAADASAAHRTARLVAASDPENITVMLQLRGACAVAQDGRSSVMSSRTFGSWHSSSPYVVAAQRPFEMVGVTCPAALLGRDADRVRGLTARSVDASRGVGALLRSQLLSLRQILRAGALSPTARQHVAGSLCELLLASAGHADGGQSAPTRSELMRAQVSRYIEANLTRSGLDANIVAHENFISRSQLDRLFREHGQSVSRFIWAKRLARARDDLLDPGRSHEQIFEIASRWGFASPSHFSHAFRSRYGESPRDFRRLAIHPH